jgi:hypothetical protein
MDSRGAPLLSRGFLEVYHCAEVADLRQAVRAYLHHVLVWGRADLWTSFDRLGLKLPGHPDAGGLPLHVDQNPRVHPGFRTVQGVLALSDNPAEAGALVVAPGSRSLFRRLAEFAPQRGDYVEIPPGSAVHRELSERAQALPLREGDLATWDGRTAHCNSANVSRNLARRVAYVAAGPAREGDAAAALARRDSFATGTGANVRSALMHATRKPRFDDPAWLAARRRPERLTALGELLYGFRRYADER